MANTALRLVVPAGEKPTVTTPRRQKNADLRTREHLTPAEAARLIEAARKNRHGARDALMMSMAYRHGLRVTELTDLQWSDVDFNGAMLHVRRRKKSAPSTHPIQGDELRSLRKLRRDNPHAAFVFLSERNAPFSADAIQVMIKRTAERAGLTDLKVHPHMLRHACGHKLANEGRDTRSIQDYLGHRDIRHTVRYTALSPDRFKDFRW